MTTLFDKFQKRISSNAAINPEGEVLVFLFENLCELIEEELKSRDDQFRKHVENSFGHGQFRDKTEFRR